MSTGGASGHWRGAVVLGVFLPGLALGLIAACGGNARTDHAPSSTPDIDAPEMGAAPEVGGMPEVGESDALQPLGCNVAIAPALLDSPEFELNQSCFDNFDFECINNERPSRNALELTRDAATLRLQHYCGDCHGLTSVADRQGTFGRVNNLARLSESGLLYRCSASASTLIGAIRSGAMPPEDYAGPRMDEGQLERLSLALDDECRLMNCICESEPGTSGCSALRIENLLDERCGSCHGSGARTPERLGPGMTYIDDLRMLTAEGKIIPCSAERSPLLEWARTPHVVSVPQLSAAEANGLAEFIDGMCSEFAASDDPSSERLDIQVLLSGYCGDCHGRRALERGTSPLPFSQVESSPALLEAGWLVPCASSQSPLLQRVRDGSMPPPEANLPRPTEVELDAIASFIDRPCARP